MKDLGDIEKTENADKNVTISTKGFVPAVGLTVIGIIAAVALICSLK